MDEEQFRKLCPNLYAEHKNNQRCFEIYGIKIKCSTGSYHELIQKYEEGKAFSLHARSMCLQQIIQFKLN